METLFLGVNLLDRFLSKGFFKTKKNFQIVGIACLTLATRIEENQPLNSDFREFKDEVGSKRGRETTSPQCWVRRTKASCSWPTAQLH